MTKDACKNKLYGTTVVPTKPIIVNKLPFGNEGTRAPFNILEIAGFVKKAVIKKEILIIITSITSTLSRNL